MAKALAGEVASRGVTVNCVAPGFIETAMTAALFIFTPMAITMIGSTTGTIPIAMSLRRGATFGCAPS